MLFRKKLYAVTGISVLCVLIYSAFVVYKSQDSYTRAFKRNMELSFSEMTNSKASIKEISGNPFNNIFFKGLVFDYGKFRLYFERARLEYSLFDILSDTAPKTGAKETVLSLSRGLLVLENNIVALERIKGKIRLRQGKIILEGMDFVVFEQFACKVDGLILTEAAPYRVELSFFISRVFDEMKFIFSDINAIVTGPVNNLSVRGKINRDDMPSIHFKGYSIQNENIFTIGSRLGIQKQGSDINHLLSIDAEINPLDKTFNGVIMPNSGKISFTGIYDKEGMVSAEFKNQQLKVFGQDFSNMVYLKAEPVFNDSTITHCLLDFNTQASVVNYQPACELEASLILDPDRVRVVYAKAGDMASASGVVNIKPPVRLSLNINFNNLVLEQFINLIIENRPDVSGTVSGRMSIKGPAVNPLAEAQISAKNGNLGSMTYENMVINADGTWPYLNINNSRIINKDSSLKLDGELNMRKFGTGLFLEDVTVSTSDNTVVWEGWDITRADEGSDFQLKRSIGSGITVGYKARSGDETKYKPVTERDEFQLEYGLADEESFLELRAREDEEFFGIKKRFKF